MDTKNIDFYRQVLLASGEWIDAWRIIPRILVGGYAYLLYKIVIWYMNLTPYMLEGCVPIKTATECLINNPTPQHSFLVTTVVGISAAVFGLYTNSGRKWADFTYWNSPNPPKDSK